MSIVLSWVLGRLCFFRFPPLENGGYFRSLPWDPATASVQIVLLLSMAEMTSEERRKMLAGFAQWSEM